MDKSLLEDIADELSGFDNTDLPEVKEELSEEKENTDKDEYHSGDYVKVEILDNIAKVYKLNSVESVKLLERVMYGYNILFSNNKVMFTDENYIIRHLAPEEIEAFEEKLSQSIKESSVVDNDACCGTLHDNSIEPAASIEIESNNYEYKRNDIVAVYWTYFDTKPKFRYFGRILDPSTPSKKHYYVCRLDNGCKCNDIESIGVENIRLATSEEIAKLSTENLLFKYHAGDYIKVRLYDDLVQKMAHAKILNAFTDFGKKYKVLLANGSTSTVNEEDIVDLLDEKEIAGMRDAEELYIHILEEQTRNRDIKQAPTSKPKSINLDEYHSCVDRIRRFFDNKETAGRPYGFINGDRKIFIGDYIEYRPMHINETGEEFFIDVLDNKKTGMIVNVEIYPNEKSNKNFRTKPVKYLFTVLPENEQNTELVLDDCITRY